MKIDKIKKNSYKLILIVLLIMVCYSTYRSIFDIYKPSIELSPIIIIFGILVFIFTFINLKKLISKIKENKANLIAVCICISFFIALSVFGNIFTSIPTYDLSNIIGEVEIMMQNGGKFVTEEYFARCTNQPPVTILVYYIYCLGNIIGFTNLRMFTIIMNSLLIVVTSFFTYLSVKKVKDYKTALITLIFFAVNPCFYIYSSYFYTYTLCMPFASIAIYLYIVAIKNSSIKKSILLLFLGGLLISIGFEIRVVVGILLIGIIIGICLNDKFNAKTLGKLAGLSFGFVAGIIIYTIISIPFDIIKNKDLELPITHYVMYSLNEKSQGKWNLEDYMYTYNNNTYSKKVEANIEMIKERMKDLGIKGWLTLTKEKIAVNWSNGEYDYFPKFLNVEKINSLYEYITGNRKVFIIYYCQICKAVMMFILCVAILGELVSKQKDNTNNYIYISIFGAFLFYLFWEVASSYSLCFLPWMIILFGVGLNKIEKALEIKRISYNINSKETIVDISKFSKNIGITIIITSLFLIVINYPEYAIKEELRWDKRVMQYKEVGNFAPDLSDDVIQQSFKTAKSFNCISIKLKKQNINNVQKYRFILKTEQGEILSTQEFTNSEIKNDELKTFYFKKVTPKENKKYIIELCSVEKNSDKTIAVATFYQNGYEAYLDGDLTINEENTNADLVFQVQNEVVRPYTNKRVYIALSIIIIVIEIFAFYPYLIKKRCK